MTKKTRLTKSSRQLIDNHGLKHIVASIDRTAEKEQLALIVEGANATVRAKYPEADMAVLRKYGLGTIDRCLRFQLPSGRVDGFRFDWSDDRLVDLPYRRGCGGGDVFPVTEVFEAAYDLHAKLKQDNDKSETAKLRQFRDFLAACNYVHEVLEVIVLPDDVLRRMGQGSTSLVAVSPETVESLKATFAVTDKEVV